ncbi:PREDICTED: two pore calcium channel protein 1-like [Dufourea novaeangliae]|uniref:Two pore calcium channel protein 1 n=1 Tax=Dufourea novaeangliae TaxID=178035 RepID=A0A154PN53_DUFNO|nr:PREDICTED: two pore calcium channel protein 1-like [Dufourea novaeangliae]KZC12738.1 Two pore calcium channel protein 1 [Dufourea novaeangliae]
MSSPKPTEYSANYQRFNDDADLSLEQDTSQRSCQKYGSMLSCSFSGNNINSPVSNSENNQFHQKIETDEVERETMTDNAVLPLHDSFSDHDLYWEMNYHKAAIFLEEGRNNEKFESHPKHPKDLPAYLLVHNNWYYGLDLLTSLLLLVLAVVEEPAVPLFRIPVWAHGSIELFALMIIGIELTLKLRWIGWATMLKHKRTMLKCITLAIMFLEAMTVLVRQSSHFRVTRALRPIFLVDTKCFGNVRRFIRQILQTLPPILDMLGLLLFFITLYTVLGYYMFSDMNRYFSTLQDSFVSLFVLLTTANFPDVMMPSYSKNKWYAIYFVSYLSTMLYVMMNLMLAVVNETFTAAERDKFKKLFLHKRKACQHAFNLLVSKQNPDKMRFRQFEGLMRYYAPNKSIKDIVLMFRHLNASGSGVLSSEEFLNIYDTTILQWEPQYSSVPWYHSTSQPMQILCTGAHAAIRWSYFESVMYVMIVANGITMIIRILQPSDILHSARLFAASWDTFLFGGIFVTEALIKVLGLGTRWYLSSGWNLFDLGTSVMTLVAACILRIFPSATFFVLFRPLRVLRLFKMKKRYRDVFGTLVILTPLMSSTAVVMLVLYYFFAIIGMELFAGYNMRNCCKNTTVEDFYKYSANESTALGYYYLNTFDNLIASGMTLFELTVVNNWFILMNAYAFTVGMYTRLYFMVFYLVTMIVLTIVVSSFLEAFRFRIHYKKSTSKRDEEKMLHEEVELRWDDLQCIIEDFQILEKLRPSLIVGGITVFIGSRPRTREVLQKKMYTSELNEWIAEAKETERLYLSNPVYNADENFGEDGISDSDHLRSSGNSRATYRSTSNVL